MDAVYAPGSYEAARAEADAEMTEFAAKAVARADAVVRWYTDQLITRGELPEGTRFEYKLQSC